MRILLADDQKEIRALVAQQLERDGHQVVIATNGQEALKAFERQPFGAVLLDEEMPILSGVQAARAIRDREQKPGTPVVLVALTGNNTELDVKRLLAAGFDIVLGKPFSMDSLSALFAVPAGIPQRAHLPAASSAAADEPVANLLDRVGRDRKLARQLIRTFLLDTPKRTAEIENALKRRDGEKAASLAHALKGSAGVFGADAACHCCQRLQDLAHQGDFPAATSVHSQLAEEIAKLQANLRGYAGTKGSQSPGAPGKTKRAKSRRGVKPR
jgi:two-component system, sensor histidine kinase and response regulator